MGDRVRLLVSTALAWLAIHTHPRASRPVMKTMMSFLVSMSQQMSSGRDGGLIMIPWSLTPKGKALALKQQDAAVEACRIVREDQP